MENTNIPIMIGGKEYHIGDHVHVVKAYSILHYTEGIKNNINELFSGITGVISQPNNNEDYFVAEMIVDPPNDKRFRNKRMILMIDDELEFV